MGAKGITIVEEGKIINLLVPTASLGGVGDSSAFHMKEASHASIYIQNGSITNATTIRLYEATTVGLTVAATLAFKYATATASDVFAAIADATTAGFATGTSNNCSFCIELDASALTDGYPYVALHFTTAAANAIAASAILTGLRYAEDVNLTALD